MRTIPDYVLNLDAVLFLFISNFDLCYSRQVDKPSTFTVSYNGATGAIHSCVRTPSGAHEDCFLQEMDTGLYAIRFIPKENGVHYVDVKLNDHHIPDSPFALMVGSTAADPAMLHAHGDGLENGKCGMCWGLLIRTCSVKWYLVLFSIT